MVEEPQDERPSDAMMDLEPRLDISPQLNDALLARFSEPKWNDRKAAVDSVEAILQSARARPCCSAGLLPLVLAVKQTVVVHFEGMLL